MSARRIDDRRMISGILTGLRHGVQSKDAPNGYSPLKRAIIALCAGGVWACSPVYWGDSRHKSHLLRAV